MIAVSIHDRHHVYEQHRGQGPLVGDLQIRGPGVFAEYLGKPDATAKEFTPEEWFKTGDTAQLDEETGCFKILGRSSVDIIK